MIGGLLAFRANDLDAAQNALGRVAVGLAQTFNDQHRLGQDLNGALGGNFFAAPSPVVIAQSTNAPGSTVTASIASAGALTTSDYRLSYNAGVYSVTRLSDNTVTNFAGLPQTVDGVTITLSAGVLSNGDSFLIEPTRTHDAFLRRQVVRPHARGRAFCLGLVGLAGHAFQQRIDFFL